MKPVAERAAPAQAAQHSETMNNDSETLISDHESGSYLDHC